MHFRREKRIFATPVRRLTPSSSSRWTVLSGFLLLVFGLISPVEATFGDLQKNAPALAVFSDFLDLFFVVDTVLNFFVAYEKEDMHHYEFDQRLVARRYLHSWFIPDAISVVPTEILKRLFQSDAVFVFRAFRLLRLLKMLRMIRAGRILNRIVFQNAIPMELFALAKSLVPLILPRSRRLDMLGSSK